jgi:hypothetical protein
MKTLNPRTQSTLRQWLSEWFCKHFGHITTGELTGYGQAWCGRCGHVNKGFAPENYPQWQAPDHHKHEWVKPIASMYVSFNCRDIIYECVCGKREVIRMNFYFSEPLPIPTNNFMTHNEFKEILNTNPYKS